MSRTSAANCWPSLSAEAGEVVHEYSDHGISGVKDRDKRPAFDRMLKGATRREFDMIAAWSVDRLGRSYSTS